MKAVHKKRLLKLYEYMQQPQSKLAHKKFYFGHFNSIEGHQLENACGTSGCMAGELPGIFPKQWMWCHYVVFLRSKSTYIGADLSQFFGLDLYEMMHLFYPLGQDAGIDPYFRSHHTLSSKSTKKQVVANLGRFLKIKGII